MAAALDILKQGTVIRSIRLTDDPEEIDCRHETIRGLVFGALMIHGLGHGGAAQLGRVGVGTREAHGKRITQAERGVVPPVDLHPLDGQAGPPRKLLGHQPGELLLHVEAVLALVQRGLERGAGPGLIFRTPPIALLNCREVSGLLRGFSFFSALPPSPHRFRSWR